MLLLLKLVQNACKCSTKTSFNWHSFWGTLNLHPGLSSAHDDSDWLVDIQTRSGDMATQNYCVSQIGDEMIILSGTTSWASLQFTSAAGQVPFRNLVCMMCIKRPWLASRDILVRGDGAHHWAAWLWWRILHISLFSGINIYKSCFCYSYLKVFFIIREYQICKRRML